MLSAGRERCAQFKGARSDTTCRNSDAKGFAPNERFAHRNDYHFCFVIMESRLFLGGVRAPSVIIRSSAHQLSSAPGRQWRRRQSMTTYMNVHKARILSGKISTSRAQSQPRLKLKVGRLRPFFCTAKVRQLPHRPVVVE